jgi:hypothetical protein
MKSKFLVKSRVFCTPIRVKNSVVFAAGMGLYEFFKWGANLPSLAGAREFRRRIAEEEKAITEMIEEQEN